MGAARQDFKTCRPGYAGPDTPGSPGYHKALNEA
jgi:hypothetical protein